MDKKNKSAIDNCQNENLSDIGAQERFCCRKVGGTMQAVSRSGWRRKWLVWWTKEGPPL